MKKIVVLAVLISYNLFAQSGGINSFFNAQIPVSPNAAELGKFAQIPIGQFTGTMQYSLPIYEIKLNDFSLPITLNYGSNGINVDKYESTVGMDWSLNYGGIVNRLLYDDPDELCRITFPAPPYYMGSMSAVEIGNILTSECSDIQYDIFVFSANGYSGKFYLDDNLLPKQIEPSLIKIEFSDNNTLENFNEIDIIITTPDGNKFYYGGNKGTEYNFSISRNLQNSGHSTPSLLTKVSWNLSKIETFKGEKIDFHYSTNNKTYDVGISQSAKAVKFGMSYTIGQRLLPSITRTTFREPKLDSIVWQNKKIVLNYNSNKKIIGVEVFDNKITGSKIKKFELSYLQVGSNNVFLNPDCSNCLIDNNRYFLSELIEVNVQNSLDIKKHSFEYENLSGLPPRLTYARDYWGYFNGKNNANLFPNEVNNFSMANYHSTISENYNTAVVKKMFNGIGGDRTADPSFAKNGLLKKIIYPTKGYSEIEYEANSIYGPQEVYHYETKQLQTNTSTLWSNSHSVTINSPKEQIVDISGALNFISNTTNEYTSCDLSEYPPHWIRGTISVQDLATNTNIPIYIGSTNLVTPNPEVLYSYTIIGQTSVNNISVHLEENHSYKFEIKLAKPCLGINAQFTYMDSFTTELINKPVGGMRVKSINHVDNKGNIHSENYKYGTQSCLDCSSGVMESILPGISFFESGSNGGSINSQCVLGSSSLNSLSFSESYHISYPIVYKLFNNTQNNGVLKFEYDVVQGNPATVLEGDYIPGTPYTNGFGSGNILSETVFDNNFNPLKEKKYFYMRNNLFRNRLSSYNISASSSATINSINNISLVYNWYNVNKYFIEIERQYLSSIVEKTYFPSGFSSQTTEYKYDNPPYLQLSSETTTNSLGEVLETKYYYPQDSQMANEPYKADLIASNMIGTPIDTQTFKNGVKLSEQKTQYAKDATTNNLLLPKYIKAKKGTDIDQPNLETKITFNSYDTKGNITQYTQESGVPVSIIWGYNQTQPVAKLENIAYSSIPASLITNIQSVSNLPTSTEAQIFTELNSLRTSTDANLQKALITTYTYKPLIGVSTITDPKGDTMTYEYDAFGRLSTVKDKTGNKLSENEYHYRP